ncbi:MAG: hypothetical protein AAGA42_17345 [Actinomycetota bacterium]
MALAPEFDYVTDVCETFTVGPVSAELPMVYNGFVQLMPRNPIDIDQLPPDLTVVELASGTVICEVSSAVESVRRMQCLRNPEVDGELVPSVNVRWNVDEIALDEAVVQGVVIDYIAAVS